MPLRRVALLCLLTCTPDLHGEVTDDDDDAHTPVPKDSSLRSARDNPPTPPPVPRSITGLGAPVPGASEARLRLLHANLQAYAPLADDTLLIWPWPTDDDAETGAQRLDLTTGAVTPWSQSWTPEAAGWRLRRDSATGPFGHEVTHDGQRVAVAYSFAPRTLPPDHRGELVAIVVSRSDGSEPRCIGIGVPSDDPPPFSWAHDGRRLIGDWTVACEPDRRGRPTLLHPERPDTFLVSMPWLDLVDGRGGDIPYRFVSQGRDPLGDLVANNFADSRGVGLEHFNLATGAVLGVALEEPAQDFHDPRWVSADAVLVDVTSEDGRTQLSQRLVYSDGRSVAVPGPRWQVYTRLPGDQVLLSRDGGRTVEQAHVDWTRFQVESSLPRPELARFTAPAPGQSPASWRPGLGGVLIDDPSGLYLAAL